MRGAEARRKPLKVVTLPCALTTNLVSFELPAPRTACRFIDPDNPGQLIALLQNEAKVI